MGTTMNHLEHLFLNSEEISVFVLTFTAEMNQ